jgi:tetratricopeptide (TPR) repeat protein
MTKKILIAWIFFSSLSLNAQSTGLGSQINNAANLMKQGNHLAAAQRLFNLVNEAEGTSVRARIKYLLGVSLMELNLNQVAAFQFVEVIRTGDAKWTKPALEKLLVVTDKLGDETLLNFVIQRIEINQMPSANKEMLFFRLAETKHKSGLQTEAIPFYKRVSSKSRYYFNALYNQGLAQAELGQTDEAIKTFSRLIEARSKAKPNDTNKVAAQMGIARTYYQQQKWDKSIEAYSKIPRDHVLWHAALFEQTWAMLRSARFRSTLSNFQSLHSSYYEDAYLPETLILRAIVYLYICQYDEMEKVLSLFDGQYIPALKQVTNFLQSNDAEGHFKELNRSLQIKAGTVSRKKLTIPYNIIRHIGAEGDVRRNIAYLKKIVEEKESLEKNSSLRQSKIGEYGTKLLNNRIRSTRNNIGNLVKRHLEKVKVELSDLNEQSGFVRYEMLNGRKQLIQKKMQNKSKSKVAKVDEKQNREFYVQNGYEFYPFQGEYWLDEIGNYHYLGKQSCE